MALKKPRACAHCYEKKLKCDGKTPCRECILRGITCTPRERKPYTKKRKAPGTAASRNKKTKTNNVSVQNNVREERAPVLPAGNTFMFTQLVHNKVMTVFSKLPSSHFGLQSAVRVLHKIARAKTNWYLMTAVSWLATTTGIGGKSSFATEKTTNNRLEVGNFDAPTFLLRVHDEAVGVPHEGHWENCGDRIITTNYSEYLGGCICVSPRFDQLFGNLPGLRENIVLPTFHSQEYAWSRIVGNQFYKFVDCIFDRMKQYETPSSGPFSWCIPDIVIVTPGGPLVGNYYHTLWLGTNGLNGCEIGEFVPHAEVSPSALKGTEFKDTDAAHAILNLITY